MKENTNILLDISIFFSILLFFIYAMKMESNDFKWRNGDHNITEKDNVFESLNKMENIINDQMEFPKWRMSFITSLILSIFLSILLLHSINIRILIIILLCSFTVIYSINNWYVFHYHNEVDKKLIKIIKNIKIHNNKID
jgi:hypothetical protein